MTDSATFTTPEADDEDTGEDLGGLDDLLASLRSDETPAPKRGSKPKDFWQVVGRFDTSYPEHRQWLKERGKGLL